ncbi:hypothetical protein [Sphingobacterium athyrii]|uniref:Uncharacterized protein n=1 Tax=Sphingobacterium athyrii TaxID=2152717 RepID=A0A363NQU6_9SPHI|nr:hypothetical protein [Sphingobacterium athyrii]PUV23144.1 hypothetical protein DCO56_19735 [Sphingobacterium athyrii]
MIEEMPFNIDIKLNPFRLKQCYQNDYNTKDWTDNQHFAFMAYPLGYIDENGKKFWHDDYSMIYDLSSMLLNEDYENLDQYHKEMILALIFESLCLINTYLDYEWELHYKLLDNKESDGMNHQELVNWEIADVEELVKLLRIRKNISRSEISIKHRDEKGNLISQDNILVDPASSKEILDKLIDDRYSKFDDRIKGRYNTNFITSNSILSVAINEGLEFEFTLEYFIRLHKQMCVFKISKNKSARRIFSSLVAKSLMKFLDILIDEAGPKVAPMMKQKHLYIFSAMRFFGMIPIDSPKLIPPSGNYSEKEDFIKDLLKM